LPESIGVKRPLLLLAVVLGLSVALWGPARAADGWETDLKKAQEQARSSNKLVVLDFTGSDWCGYCIRLDRDLFSKPAFKEYASKNLILVEVDFPRAKEQSSDLKKQNRDLATQYEVQGFPTLVVLDGAGKKVWRCDGYFPGGPDAFIAELEKAKKG
jgi:protein disulfide-isomerase